MLCVIIKEKKREGKKIKTVLNHLLVLSLQTPHLPAFSNLLPQFINCFIG